MAVIQKIRDKYGKIAGGLIGLSLVSFIAMDAFNGSGSFSSLFSRNSSQVMTVNGTKIDAKEYELRVAEYEKLTEIYSNRGPLDDAARAQIREQVLQAMAYEAIASKMCDKLGIIVSEKEEKEMIYGPNVHGMIRQFQIGGQQIFINPQTKQFDPNQIKGLEDELKKNGARVDPDHKIADAWQAAKNYVIRNARIDKFNSLLGAGAISPRYEAKRAFEEQNMMASVRYVKVPYTFIPDAEVKVTDDDVKAFVEKHKAMFEVKQASRSIDYVSFDINPSSADSFRAAQALVDIKAELAESKDDKTFAGNKSDDLSAFSEAYVSKKTLASAVADTLLALPVGTIYGPYVDQGSYRLTKVVDKKVLPDSVQVRHILIKTADGSNVVLADSIAKARIDSIETAIKNGASFDSLMMKYTNDEGSKQSKGEYWFTLQQRPGLSKEFADFAFENAKGGRKVVKVDNSKNGGYSGYHYIEVLDQKNVGPTTKFTTIVKNLAPSDSTVNAIYALANEFASKSTTAAAFDANVKKMGLDKRVGENLKENSYTINGLGSARDIIKWAYKGNVGDVSKDPFRLNDLRYVVAKVAGEQAKGIATISPAMRPMIEQKIREQKKAAKIADKFKGGNLDAIATATAGQVQQSDSVVLGAPYIPGAGYEPKVVGYAFNNALQLNATSPGIASQSGVYFITVLNRTKKPVDPVSEQMNVMQLARNQEMQLRNYMGQALTQSLLDKAEIKYNLDRF